MSDPEKSKTWQFEELLAARRERGKTARVKPRERLAEPLPAEAVDPERAGEQTAPPLATAPEAAHVKPGKGGKGPKPKQRVRFNRLREPSRIRLRMADPVELVVAMLDAPRHVRRVATQAARVKRQDGRTDAEVLTQAVLDFYGAECPWVTQREIRKAVAERSGEARWSKYKVQQATSKAARNGLLDTRPVVDPVKDRVVPEPGGTVPKRLWRVSRAGKALLGLLG